MTATALDLPDRDQPVEPTHPDWCQRGDRCRINKDGSVTHSHLMGSIDDRIDVFAEQTDKTNDRGKKQSTTQAYWVVNQPGRMSSRDGSRLNTLLARAGRFTGDRSPGCS